MPVKLRAQSSKLAVIIVIVSRRADDAEMAIGDIREAMPMIKSMFAILLPTIFPIAISEEPLSAAPTDTVISGMDVPKPMTTAPIKRRDNPRRCANETAPLIRNSPP